jgi:hypothetical protein
MILGTISMFLFILAFAYIILVLANKESGNMKLAGQILAALIAILAILSLFFGQMRHERMMGGMNDGMMGEKCEKCEMMDKATDGKTMDKSMDKKMTTMKTTKMQKTTK